MKSYEESQKFSRFPIMLILVPISVGFCFLAIWQVGFGHKVGNHPVSDSGSILIAFLVSLLTLAFYFVKLETEISEEGISYRFRFILSYGGHIAWPEVKEVHFIRYPYIGEGIRWYNEKNCWAYVTQNDEGLGILIIGKNGKTNILLSTHQMPALKDYLRTLDPEGVELAED